MSTEFLRTRKALAAAIALLVLGSGVWGVTVMTKGKKSTLPKELSPEALKADSDDPHKMFEKVHQAFESGNLTEQQRDELRHNMHTMMEARMNQRMDEYFKAPADQKQAVLDRQIDEMQARMKEWEQRRAERQARGAATGSNGPSGGGAAATSGGTSGGTANAGGPPGGDRGGRGGRGEPSREQRKGWSESRNPNERARQMAYWTAVQERSQQRGVQVPMWGGGRGGRQ